MRTPTDFELQHMILRENGYDPVKAHQYYEEHKKLKGRRRGAQASSGGRRPSAQDPRTGRTRQEIHQTARARQRKELATRIQSLQNKLNKLEAKIREMEHKDASENRKSRAKKERSAKERDKPDSAAEKAKKSRESEKYRKQHRQELSNKAKKDSKSGGGSKKSGSHTEKISQLKTLAKKVKGQIAVAKQKLAAL